MTIDLRAKARIYGEFFETLTPDSIENVRSLVSDDVRFKDPFNDVRGADKLVRILGKMFEDADDVSFTMREQAGVDRVYFLRWYFNCRPKSRFLDDAWQVDGISVITLTGEGLIKDHTDYWDAGEQLYEHLPLVGGLLRLVRRPLTLKD
ncbi:MAG: nuclear transport factor 2 family protein [Geminicoccaceae bacterium]